MELAFSVAIRRARTQQQRFLKRFGPSLLADTKMTTKLWPNYKAAMTNFWRAHKCTFETFVFHGYVAKRARPLSRYSVMDKQMVRRPATASSLQSKAIKTVHQGFLDPHEAVAEPAENSELASTTPQLRVTKNFRRQRKCRNSELEQISGSIMPSSLRNLGSHRYQLRRSKKRQRRVTA